MLRSKTIRGLKTAWLEAGEVGRPILLFLHGFPDTADCWSLQLAHFSEKYHVIAPFVRGAGPSEAAAEMRRYGPDAVALDVLEILADADPKGERPVYLVGHDLGSVHAWHLAGLLQKRAKGLIIVNGMTIRQMVGRLGMPRQLAKSWYMYLLQLPLLPELLVRGFAKPLHDLAYDLGGLAREKRPTETTGKAAMLAPLNQYRAFMRLVPKLARRPRQRLDCPVLVVFGADDRFMVPPSQAEILPDARNLTLRIIRGNHWLHREQPERMNKLIGDFIAVPG